MKKWMKHVVFCCLMLVVFLHVASVDASADSSYQLRLDGTWMSSVSLPNTYLKPVVSHNYSFTLAQDSLVTFTSRRVTLENGSYDIIKNGKSYIGGYLDGGLDNSITAALNAGTYTLQIHTERYWEYSGSYQVKAKATVLGTTEKEPNGDSAIAMSLAAGQSVKGVLSMVDDTNDWYTFMVPSTSKTTISVSVIQGALTFEVYGSDLQKVHEDVFWYYNDAFTVSPSTKTVTYELEPGKYYLRCYSWGKDGFNKNKNTPDLQSMALYTVQWSRKVPVTGITLSGAGTVKAGSSTTFSAYVLPTDATNKSIKWTSSNTAVAVVNSSGKVTGVSAGEAVIFAMASDGSGVAESRKITVTAAGSGGSGGSGGTGGNGGSGSSSTSIGTSSAPTLTNQAKGIKVSWDKVSGASGYYVYRSKNKGSFQKVKTVSSGSTVSYTDTAATTNGAKYQYRIVAYGKSGKTGKSSSASVLYRLPKPSTPSATNTSGKKITVKWQKNTKATGYQIKYVTGSVAKTATIKKNSTTKTILKSLKKNKTYKVYVRTYKSASGTKYYSAWSAAKSVKVKK